MCDESRTVMPVSLTASITRGQELAPGQRVERGDGLVEQQQLGPLGQRERERDLRLLAARRACRPSASSGELQALDALARDRVVPARVQLAPEPERLARS